MKFVTEIVKVFFLFFFLRGAFRVAEPGEEVGKCWEVGRQREEVRARSYRAGRGKGKRRERRGKEEAEQTVLALREGWCM